MYLQLPERALFTKISVGLIAIKAVACKEVISLGFA